MRKLFMGAVAASAVAWLAVGFATAQAPAEGEFTATISPSDAGTKTKPKNTKATFGTTIATPNSTASTIEITLPSTLKFSGKGLKRCSADTLIAAGGTSQCPAGSIAGPKGSAEALAGAASSPEKVPDHIDVYPVVAGDRTVLFYLDDAIGALQRPIAGQITNKGHKLTITIPLELRKIGGLDASLVSLKQTFSGRSGRHYFLSSTGCRKHKWKVGGKITFASRADGTPVPGPLVDSARVRCTK